MSECEAVGGIRFDFHLYHKFREIVLRLPLVARAVMRKAPRIACRTPGDSALALRMFHYIFCAFEENTKNITPVIISGVFRLL